MEMPKNAPDKEEIKEKLAEKLPVLLPKVIKWVVVHIAMLIYHVSMPPWVTAIKAKRAVDSFKADKNGTQETAELPTQTVQPSKREQARQRRNERLEERRVRRASYRN